MAQALATNGTDLSDRTPGAVCLAALHRHRRGSGAPRRPLRRGGASGGLPSGARAACAQRAAGTQTKAGELPGDGSAPPAVSKGLTWPTRLPSRHSRRAAALAASAAALTDLCMSNARLGWHQALPARRSHTVGTGQCGPSIPGRPDALTAGPFREVTVPQTPAEAGEGGLPPRPVPVRAAALLARGSRRLLRRAMPAVGRKGCGAASGEDAALASVRRRSAARPESKGTAMFVWPADGTPTC